MSRFRLLLAFFYCLLIVKQGTGQVLSPKALQRAQIHTSISIAAQQPDSVFILELTALKDWSSLAKFRNLNILRIHDHQLQDELIDFGSFPYLQELVIKAKYYYSDDNSPPTRLYKLSESIVKLKNLKVLDLSNNALGLGTGLEHIAQLPTLEVLNLVNNEIGVEFFIEETIAEVVEEYEEEEITVGDSLYKTIRKDIIEEYLYSGNWEGEDVLYVLINKLKNLKELNVSSNFIRDIPEQIKQLTALQRLNIANNHLFQLPVGLCALTKLERLYAERNYIHILPEDIGELKELQKITLYQNPLYTLPKSFGQLHQLKELQFERNYHLDWTNVFEVLKKLDNLMKLEIRHCGIEKMPKELTKLKHLKELNLYNNELLRFPDNIDQLTQLRSLIICDAGLYKLPDGLKKLQNLQTLVLYACDELNWDAAFQLLGESVSLPKLRLDISYNTIEKWPTSIQKLSKLKQLQVYDAPKTRKNYNLLRKLLPSRLTEADWQRFNNK
ncbi:MAG: leucine-rich repeat domain-containing protein [Aureispira sp.]|nr:leucine-rich repeat domain-containing protein [Aureispira sp.]